MSSTDLVAGGGSGSQRIPAQRQDEPRLTVPAGRDTPRTVEADEACTYVWQAQALARARLLRAQWATWGASAQPAVDEQFQRLLATVELRCREGWHPRRTFTGSAVEQTWSALHAAEVLLVEQVPAAELPGVLPWVLDGLRQQLPEESVQRTWLRQGTQPAPTSRQVALALRTAHDASDAAHVRARSFSRMVLIAGIVGLVAVVGLCVLGALRPTALPLCTGEPGACVTSGQARGLDVTVVALVGAGGAVLSAVAALRHLCGTSTPYAVPVALAALKVPLGALTAVLGLLVLRSQPGGIDVGLTSAGGLLAWAVALGASQELFTRLVDLRGQAVLNAVTSKSTTPAKP